MMQLVLAAAALVGVTLAINSVSLPLSVYLGIVASLALIGFPILSEKLHSLIADGLAKIPVTTPAEGADLSATESAINQTVQAATALNDSALNAITNLPPEATSSAVVIAILMVVGLVSNMTHKN